MRARAGETDEQLAAKLSDEQLSRLSAAERARSDVDAALHEVATRQSRLRLEVWRALDAGVPSTLIASKLGVTNKRIYQMRNQAKEQFDEASV